MKKNLSLLLCITGLAWAHTYTLSQTGWHLLGAVTSHSDMEAFARSCVASVWRYEDGTWLEYTPGSSGTTLSSLQSGEGFWLENSTPCTLESGGSLERFTEWQSLFFTDATGGQADHINNILCLDDRVVAAYYTHGVGGFVATSDDGGKSWNHVEIPEMSQIKHLLRLSDGRLILGGEALDNAPILYSSSNEGESWEAISTTGSATLPNASAQIAWKLAQAKDGTIYIATDSLTNDPTQPNSVVYALNPEGWELSALAPVEAMGVMSLALDSKDRLYIATEESSEHDDPELAGQARLYRSEDKGLSWQLLGAPEGANRIYDIHIREDDTIYIGGGLLGTFHLSKDGGQSWVRQSALDTGDAISRIYNIFELRDGRILAGTGNTYGDVYLSDDEGESWSKTGTLGTNIVTWAIDQCEDGTVWLGTGSYGGDIFTSK